MSTTINDLSAQSPTTAEGVLDRVNALVEVLRSRAPETEKLRRVHPANIRDLTAAGVFRLPMPTDVGGYQADDAIIHEVLSQIARGCPSTCWVASVIVSNNVIPALLPDSVADEIYATPDLRMTGVGAPTGTATPVDGGYRVTGRWVWNTGGVHSNWLMLGAMTPTDDEPAMIMPLIPVSEVTHEDTWHAAGMAGTASNTVVATDVFVPAERVASMANLATGSYPARRYSDNPYFNRPFVMYVSVLSLPVFIGMARGAMDVFTKTLADRGQIAYTNWTRAAEAPVLHHQLAKAQLDLETAEMFANRLLELYRNTLTQTPTITERAQARAWLSRTARAARDCVNQLFEASSASQILLSADLQRYFRDTNTLYLHGAIQPTSSDELYGRILAGLEPNTEML